MKIVVTGSRYWPRSMLYIIDKELDEIVEDFWSCESPESVVHLYHGACPYGVDTDSPYKGVDGHCDAYGRSRGWKVHPIPAVPSEGRSSPSGRDFAIRNQKLIDTKPDIVLGFFLNDFENRDTQMTVDMARRKHLDVVEIRRNIV